MPRTYIGLDVQRTELVERSLYFDSQAQGITSAAGGRNLVFQWPGTKSWTLQPVNLTTSFSESLEWEGVKLRLSDFNSDYLHLWQESAELTDPDGTPGNGSSDGMSAGVVRFGDAVDRFAASVNQAMSWNQVGGSQIGKGFSEADFAMLSKQRIEGAVG